MLNSKKQLCIYHGNCADGFTSAWVVRKKLGESVRFHAGIYNNEPPDVRGLNVVIVDFSYKRNVLERMIDLADTVTILDHHKTAKEDLDGLSGATTVFDMERSGARITWDYFFPGEPPPQMLLHVEDRDLWRFALPKTREIQASIFSHPYDFSIWDKLMAANPALLAKEGEIIERKHLKDISELISVVTRPMQIGRYIVNVANLPYTMASDAGCALAKKNPFGACYWDTKEGRVFSLRSTDDGPDVSEIAKLYGGGGHRNAAGFRVSFEQAMEFEL